MEQPFFQTERLELLVEDPAEVLIRVENMRPEDRAEVSPVWIERIRLLTQPDPWLQGFVIREKSGGALAGYCGFKGQPDPDGMVEVAYGIEPEFRSRGYATEVTRALVSFAFQQPLVRVIRAHTRAEHGASQRVLEKAGFSRLGMVEDPEDGPVERWELWPPAVR